MFARFLSLALLFTLCAGSAHAVPVQKSITIRTGVAGSPNLWNSGITIAELALAKSDYIRLPILLSSDHQLFLGEDVELTKTDAKQIFPQDGNQDIYSFDLSISQLHSIHPQGASRPMGITLSEVLDLYQGSSERYGEKIGVALELRSPWLYRKNDLKILPPLFEVITAEKYAGLNFLIQSYDPEQLKKIHHELSERGLKIPLVLLLGQNDGYEVKEYDFGRWQPYNYDWLYTSTGLRFIASFANAIALSNENIQTNKLSANYLAQGQAYGLAIFSRGNQGDIAPELSGFFSGFYSDQQSVTVKTDVSGTPHTDENPKEQTDILVPTPTPHKDEIL